MDNKHANMFDDQFGLIFNRSFLGQRNTYKDVQAHTITGWDDWARQVGGQSPTQLHLTTHQFTGEGEVCFTCIKWKEYIEGQWSPNDIFPYS